MISIFALIYKSPAYADSLIASLNATTPELLDGTAEFFFLANNATHEVRHHLVKKGYTHYVRVEPIPPPDESPPDIFRGYNERLQLSEQEKSRSDKYDYMVDVYGGWNAGIEHARGDIIVPVNSDHVFADGWLTELRRRWRPSVLLSPVMFEPGRGGNKIRFPRKNGTGAFPLEAGTAPSEFDEDAFRSACRKHPVSPRLTRGGCYMPCMMLKQVVIDHGMFRPGNIRRPRGNYANTGFPADVAFFKKLSKQAGMDHQTCHTSFCYHFQEGEMRG